MINIFNNVPFIILKNTNTKLNGGNLEYDSRKIKKGDIFVALTGHDVDGHDYIDNAVKNGAIAVIVSKKVELIHDVSYFLVENLRTNLGCIASNFYNHPEKNLQIIGVTGTNGKTSTTYFIEQLLGEENTARIGTIEYKIGNEVIEAPNTTPESLDIVKMCKKAVEKNIRYFVMEVSSHGLTSGRVDFLDFDIAIFTNLTPEHLDYHKDMEDYFQAKKLLFYKLKKKGHSVINIDDSYGKLLFNEFGGISYSLNSEADIGLDTIEKIKPPIFGKFNYYNLLAAVGVTKLLNLDMNIVYKKARNIYSAPGRFEVIKTDTDFTVIVDYAHTPDALKNVLEEINNLIRSGKIITVFGCGGDRDKTKRPEMANISEKYSNLVLVTSDNPRSENPSDIISDVIKGFKLNNYQIELDRANAIKKAVFNAEKNDIILIAGKGHENYQILGTEKIYFDDKEMVLKFVNEFKRSKK